MNASRLSRNLLTRLRIALLLVAVIVGSSLIVSPSIAHADTGSDNALFLNIGDSSSQTVGANYRTLITNLRRLSGHSWHQGVSETQSNPNAVIELQLRTSTSFVILFINPTNLYVLGFEDENGHRYAFNDHASELARLLPPDEAVAVMPFGGNYNSLTGAAGRGREATTISHTTLRAAVNQLGNNPGGDWRETARSLSLLIQYSSESARFVDVYNIMYNATAIGETYPGLPLEEQYLENDWSRISTYGRNIISNPNTANISSGSITFRNFQDVHRRLAMALNARVGGSAASGTWSKAEL